MKFLSFLLLFMKKILFLLAFILTWINSVFANNNSDLRNIESIKIQQTELKETLQLWKISNQEEIISLLDSIADLEVELAKLERRTITISANSPETRSSISRNNLKIGDIIVVKPKEPRKFASFFSAGWQHAWMYIGNNKVIEALWPWELSKYTDLNAFLTRYPMEAVMVVRFSQVERNTKNIPTFVQKYLLKKPYPNMNFLPYSKESMREFYCTSLIWRLYKNLYSIHLDHWLVPDTIWDVIYPAELLLHDNSQRMLLQ